MKQTIYTIGICLTILACAALGVIYHIQEAKVTTQIAINILGK